MDSFPSHTFCPLQHGVNIFELSPIPVLFEYAPTALIRLRRGVALRIVLAVIRRIVKQLNWLANLVRQLHHPVEKLSANSATFGSVINFQLEQFCLSLLGCTQVCPPSLQGIDDKVTGFTRTPKVDRQLPTILIDKTTRNVLFLAT